MEARNLDKIKPFIKAYNNGEIIYKDGALYRTVRVINQFKKVVLKEPELMRSLSPKRDYYRVKLNGVLCYEHIVIYAIFHGFNSLENFECIDHVDTNKLNNLIDNLEGVTEEENNKRAKENGLLASKLNKEDVLKIRELHQTHTTKKLAEMFNVSRSMIQKIISNQRWSD